MKKHLLCLLCVLSVFSLLFYKNVHAGSRYCILAQDGRILAGEGLHEKQSVASISKIMTAIVALEHSSLSRRIVIGKEIYSVDGSSVYLREKEVWSLKDLLYGLLLRSGNDAAASIAKDIGGSEETFVAWMNEKAKEIGMNDTLFRNPSGLDEADGRHPFEAEGVHIRLGRREQKRLRALCRRDQDVAAVGRQKIQRKGFRKGHTGFRKPGTGEQAEDLHGVLLFAS